MRVRGYKQSALNLEMELVDSKSPKSSGAVAFKFLKHFNVLGLNVELTKPGT